MVKSEKTAEFKAVCAKVALIMVFFFAGAIVCLLIVSYVHVNFAEQLGVTGSYMSRLILSAVFLQAIPSITAVSVFKFRSDSLYKKPPRLAKALGNFPAMYGLGQIPNLLFFLVIWIIMSFQSKQEDMARAFGGMESVFPPNIICAIALFIYAVFIAAFFEEFLCRGVILHVLKPYGNGFAVIISGLLFGLMHGNVHQFIYAFVLGIVLGYITIQTGSILASTILHAMFNSIGGIMLLLMSTRSVQDYMFGGGEEGEVLVRNSGVMAAYGMFYVMFFILVISGIALAIKRLFRLKRYKFENDFTEITTKQKFVTFFVSVPAVIMLILVIDRFAGGFIASKIFQLLKL
ncbi:MAG: CPBP family intramembrane metalloprotease [Oscillospiraceae bacterium]|nr:CPBP family intramembrane metalloprotease [Oscillospiraceae bacterium]